MKPITVLGTIDRRVLVSYRIDPDRAASCLPPPFRPALQAGVAIGTVCMIRISALRPRPLPGLVGITTENMAHRFAVEWDEPTGVQTGVFVPRRDTSSRLSHVLSGRIFPGSMAHGRYDVDDGDRRVHLRYRSDDGLVRIEVRARQTARWPERSVFGSLDEASEFFRRDSVGYSPPLTGGPCEAMEMQPTTWNAAPLEIDCLHSSWFDDESRFPRGTIELDSALVMRNIDATWVAADGLAVASATTAVR